MVKLTASKATDTSDNRFLDVIVSDLAQFTDVTATGFVAQHGNERGVVTGTGITSSSGSPTDGTITEILVQTRVGVLHDFTDAFKIEGLNLDLGDFISAHGSNPAASIIDLVFQSNDELIGSNYTDRLYGRGGEDKIFAGLGNDYAYAHDGNDTVNGADGNDQVFGGAGNDIVSGGTGNDFLGGEAGNDVVRGDAGTDSLTGGNGFDRLFGGLGADFLGGENGRDVLKGGAGKDILNGGLGLDHLFGGSGRDAFDYNTVDESRAGAARRDVIHDFNRAQHDRIDLSDIDAVTGPGNQMFRFIGNDTFKHYHATHPGVIGMVRFENGIVQANVDNKFGADFEVKVLGVTAMTAADFVL